jgi:hypothetical protein
MALVTAPVTRMQSLPTNLLHTSLRTVLPSSQALFSRSTRSLHRVTTHQYRATLLRLQSTTLAITHLARATHLLSSPATALFTIQHQATSSLRQRTASQPRVFTRQLTRLPHMANRYRSTISPQRVSTRLPTRYLLGSRRQPTVSHRRASTHPLTRHPHTPALQTTYRPGTHPPTAQSTPPRLSR